jgi:hypothetical protein
MPFEINYDAEGNITSLFHRDGIPVSYAPRIAGMIESANKENKVVKVYHHTSVAPQDFDFGNFQRGKEQVSQFGDGLNASTTTTPFLVKRYGKPIEGEVYDSEFVVVDANMSQKEMYEMLVAQGYKFTNPQSGKATAAGGAYVGGTAKDTYDDTTALKDSPGSAIELFNDFQESNPKVKGVKVMNHVIGGEKVDPFYVIYQAKSFYGPSSAPKNTPTPTAPTTPSTPAPAPTAPTAPVTPPVSGPPAVTSTVTSTDSIVAPTTNSAFFGSKKNVVTSQPDPSSIIVFGGGKVDFSALPDEVLAAMGQSQSLEGLIDNYTTSGENIDNICNGSPGPSPF